jgi:uridylate kinase
VKYKRILLKLSGESLMGDQQSGISSEKLDYYVQEIQKAVETGAEIAIVIGGGNIYRGLQGVTGGMDRVQGDYMGMLATIINSLALQARLETLNIRTVLLSGIPIEGIAGKATRRNAKNHLAAGAVVLFPGGTGNPFFTTDTAAALRAAEIDADVILKGTRVDGVYDDDPEKNPGAIRYDTLSFNEAIQKELKILDITAFTLCRENHIPIVVFDINSKGNIKQIIEGKGHGTLISS